MLSLKIQTMYVWILTRSCCVATSGTPLYPQHPKRSENLEGKIKTKERKETDTQQMSRLYWPVGGGVA